MSNKKEKNEAYATAIELFATGKVDFQAMAIKFAQQFPIQFLKAAKVSTPSVLLEEMVKEVYAKEGVVPAIKRYRVETGVGLKEAKDIVFAITGHVSCRENGK